ncbi:MAG TPA: FRG domain-containing protein [Terriglobia bacterium]|nr:FRG domain-containing protein [Terriglobia bacterium]
MAGLGGREHIPIDSFEDLTRLVQLFRKDGKWIFRGVRDGSYKLIPRIGRPESRKGRTGISLGYDHGAEKTLIRHFIRSAGPYVRHVPATCLEWLALAQHHGMFTRLLDWSESLLVATYFAVEDARKRDGHGKEAMESAAGVKDRELPPTIYCVKDIPTAPDNKHDKIDDLPAVVLYYPPHISPRIPAQSGLFTVHKNPDKPFVPMHMVRLTITKSPLTLKLNLNACGIHKASLFPGIDGLAEHQSWLYKWGEHLKYDD